MTTTVARRLWQAVTLRYFVPGDPDAHNNPADTYTDVETFCVFQQQSRMETGMEAQVSAAQWKILLSPAEQLPEAADLATVDGVDYQFVGDAYLAHDVKGAPDHIEGTCARAI
jgi:hypothetical protein